LYPPYLYTILHVNHQLRGTDADGDERFVRDLAHELGLACEVRRIDVVALTAAQTNGNIEDVGRQARYRVAGGVLDELCEQAGLDPAQGRIATAHTRDDRVETLFMRLIVGGGGSGLSSIPFVNERSIRPLLDCTRAELREWLRAGAVRETKGDGSSVLPDCSDRKDIGEAGKTDEPSPLVSRESALWREDASNQDTRRFRAFVRHEVMPLLKTRNSDMPATVARSLDVLASEDAYLQKRADELLEQNLASRTTERSVLTTPALYATPPKEENDELCLSAELFNADPVLVRRVIREACRRVMPTTARLTFAHIDNIAANGRHIGFATDIPGDVTVRNVYGTLVIRQKTAAEKPRHDPRHADGQQG
jgi:tRNA(Ile)-lysidine synthase